MFDEFKRIEFLISISNQKLELLSRAAQGDCREAFYRRKAQEAFRSATSKNSVPVQPLLAVVAFYLLLAESES